MYMYAFVCIFLCQKCNQQAMDSKYSMCDSSLMHTKHKKRVYTYIHIYTNIYTQIQIIITRKLSNPCIRVSMFQ